MLRRASAFVLIAVAILTMACTVPLGPGFHTEKELLEVRFVSGSPPHLQFRATFTLKNSGNAPLDALDLSLPNEKDFGRSNLLIAVDGAAISPHPVAEPAALAEQAPSQTRVRIRFASPWPQNARRTLVVSYEFRQATTRGALLEIGEDSFTLSAESWYPVLRAPNHLFAKGDAPPGRFDFSVFVPQDFLVHAPGHPRGKKRRAAESEFRFRIREDDFSPFVVAGRYHEQRFSDSKSIILFWTFQPLPKNEVQRTGVRFASAVRFFEKSFGPRGKGSRPVWLVEIGGMNTPEVATLTSGQVAAGISESGLSSAEFLLATTWFNHLVTPLQGLDRVIASALAEYAVLALADARGDSAGLNSQVRVWLRLYDNEEDRRREKEGSLVDMASSDSVLHIFWAETKTKLLVVALRDFCGAEIFQRGVLRMIQGLRGRTYSFTDLRVALEAESGKDLGDFFRLWLNQPGIPADFRARYAPAK